MQKHLLFLFLLVLTLLHQGAYPQRGRQFSEDQGLFPGELLTFMGINLTEKQMAGVEEFNTLWDSAAFSTTEMEAVIRSSNILLARNARAVPHMLNCRIAQHRLHFLSV